MPINQQLQTDIQTTVDNALREDIGDGDLTAELVPPSENISASIITRDNMILAGRPWVDEVFRQLDPRIKFNWQADDGDTLDAGATLCNLRGPARPILSGERVAGELRRALKEPRPDAVLALLARWKLGDAWNASASPTASGLGRLRYANARLKSLARGSDEKVARRRAGACHERR